ncbi:hypothetical protein BH11MYX4_BH11MYX4_61320 [soil metagenome]
MVERDDDRPAAAPYEDDPDAPASAEEIAASQRLRDALASSRSLDDETSSPEVELALALRAAWDPASLSADESRAVLDATPSAEEQELARALREALATRREPRPTDALDVHLAHALRAAFAPAALDDAEHRRIVEAALEKLPASRATPARVAAAKEAEGGQVLQLRRRQTVVRVAFGVVAAGLALAASITLVITSAPSHEAPLARARTTQPLFSEPFKAGETSARIDRIASARAADFRDNRFTKWGVR